MLVVALVVVAAVVDADVAVALPHPFLAVLHPSCCSSVALLVAAVLDVALDIANILPPSVVVGVVVAPILPVVVVVAVALDALKAQGHSDS